MRLAIVSDTHMPRGARRLSDACVQRLRTADAILHCGDWMRTEVVEQIAAYGPPVYGIRGNVDAPDVALPHEREDSFSGVTIGMIHDPGPAAGRLERLRARFPDAQAVLFGHTHTPEHAQRDGFQIFNPGSPTERRRASHHSMGTATIDNGIITFELHTWN